MKKTLVLVLSLLMVLSVASVASAELKIVGGQFSVTYDIDFADDKPIEGSTTGTVKGEARINLEGKYSTDKFTGYAYSRFDFNNDKVEVANKGGVPRWFMKKAEMDYIIADGFTLGLAYDQDDIKLHDELVYTTTDDKLKLKDFYNGVVMFSAKYAGDMLNVSNFNTGFTGGIFKNLTVVKLDIADAKVRALANLTQAKSGNDSFLGLDAVAEASYNFGDFELGAGARFGKAAVKDAELELGNFKVAGKVYLGSFTVVTRVRVDNNTAEDKFKVGQIYNDIAYGNYELETYYEPENKFEPKLKLKKLAGSNNDLEIKATWGYDADEQKFETKPAINVKHIFRF